MAAETPNTLNLVYGSAPEWMETVLTPLLESVGRPLVIFMGENFMNNANGQRISVMYIVDVFMAAGALNDWPAPLDQLCIGSLPNFGKYARKSR